MEAAELRDARGRSHSLSRAQGKVREVVELRCCLDSEEVRQSWLPNPRTLELRSFGGSGSSGKFRGLLGIQEGCSGKLEKPEREARSAGSTVL